MRRLFLSLVCAFVVAQHAAAQTAGDLENTAPLVPDILQAGLKISTERGEASTLRFGADGSYKTVSGEAGGWILQNDFLCLSTETGRVNCTYLDPAAAPGDVWTAMQRNGETLIYTLPPPQLPDGEGGASGEGSPPSQ